MTILRDNPRGVLVNPDEATAWVSSFNEYKAKGSDRQFWLDVWGSGPISVDREGGKRSSWVANPLASVFGGLPPDMLGTLSEQHGRNDGFIDRLLSSFPEVFPKQRWTTDELDEGDETTWFHVIQRLHDVPMHEDNGDVGPYFVYFEDDAQSAWVKFFDSHCEEMEGDNLPVSIIGVWSKLRAYAARFCLILSRLRLATNPECSDQQLQEAKVRLVDVEGAVKLVDYFKSHIARVQHRMTSGLGNQDAKVIVDWILRGDFAEFRERDLRSDLRRRFSTPESMSRALAALVRAGAIRPKLDEIDPHRKGRKLTPGYEVHPDLKTRPELHEIHENAPI